MSLAGMHLSDFLAPMHSESNSYANMLICIGKKTTAIPHRVCVLDGQTRSGRGKVDFYTKDLFSWQIKKQLLC